MGALVPGVRLPERRLGQATAEHRNGLAMAQSDGESQPQHFEANAMEHSCVTELPRLVPKPRPADIVRCPEVKLFGK